MAETTEERQARIARELQALLTVEIPAGDFSLGTVLYELLVKPAAVTLASQETGLDELRNSMSLLQVMQDPLAPESSVDNLLSNYNVSRRTGSQAVGLVNIYTTTANNVYVSNSTVIVCGGISLRPTKSFVGVVGEVNTLDTADVSYVQARQFGTGAYVFSIEAATISNTESVLSPGQKCTISIQNSFITKVEIGSTFTGGSIKETNTELLVRAATSVNSKVTTGRANIQSLLEGNEVVTVLDVGVFGMGDVLQIRDKANSAGVSSGGHVDVYVSTSPVPSSASVTLTGERQSDGMWRIDVPADPYAGAYAVTAVRYGDNEYNTDLTHVFGYDTDETAPLITAPEHARYSKYQTLHVLLTAVDINDAITTADFEVDVLFMPGIATLQEYVNDPDIRSYAFDTLIKATVPVITGVSVTIEYSQGVTPPSLDVLQQAVSNELNLQRMRTSSLESSKVVYALKDAFPLGYTRMPVILTGKIYLPDGTTAFASDNNRLTVPEEPGIGPNNTDFFCFPSDVSISLVEILI